MLYNVKINKTSPDYFLCELSNGTSTYYIKLANNEIDIECISLLLKPSFKISDLQEGQCRGLAVNTANDLLLEFAQKINKKFVLLSSETRLSSEKNPVSYSYRELDDYRDYWKGHTPFALFSALSQDIIETPYADNPSDLEYRHGKTAFHTNHGTNHAVRQYNLSKTYLDFLKQEGTAELKATANALTLEETACLDLANFLFRSGRTNEASWDADPSYGKRSAEIFRQVAIELGYKPELVNLIAQSYDYHSTLVISTALTEQNLEQTTKKAALFRTLLELAHETDLVRCEIDSDKTKRTIKKLLSAVLPESYDKDAATDSFFNFAIKLC